RDDLRAFPIRVVRHHLRPEEAAVALAVVLVLVVEKRAPGRGRKADCRGGHAADDTYRSIGLFRCRSARRLHGRLREGLGRDGRVMAPRSRPNPRPSWVGARRSWAGAARCGPAGPATTPPPRPARARARLRPSGPGTRLPGRRR